MPAQPNRQRLTKRSIASMPSGYAWDSEVPGLGVRRTQIKATYVVRFRDQHGRQRYVSLGDVGQYKTVDQAREVAQERLQAVRKGEALPRVRQQRAPTVGDLWTRYWEQHAIPHKKPSSRASDRKNWTNHAAALSKRLIAEVTHSDVVDLHRKIGKEAPGAANRTLALLSKMFSCAEKWGLREPGTNPARGVQKFKERKVERYLDDAEYARLFAALEDPDRPQSVCDALRLLVHTGCRASEVLTLRRSDVDETRRELVLRDENVKTGARRVPLNDQALALVRGRLGAVAKHPDAWLFHARRSADEPMPYTTLFEVWTEVRRAAKLTDVRIHDLRHAFASVAVNAGLSLPQIGDLLGHKTPITTARYAHLSAEVQHANARLVGAAIAKAAKPRKGRKT